MIPDNEIVSVNLPQKEYFIYIGKSEYRRLPEFLSNECGERHLIVISDDNVSDHYLTEVVEILEPIASKVDSLVVPAGEKSKSIQQADLLLQKLIKLGADRSCMIVALGGGVVGDLAGFVAGTFMRGVRFIQLPTSLLAQVDSSVGGKTGVNLPQGKNLVGLFLQPELVVVQTSTLRTLDDANYRAGLGEVVKYGMIMDVDLFQWLEENVAAINQRDEQVLSQLIAWCCRCKAQIVVEDEKETLGRRAILNYGHTFGHAIESVFGYGTYLHGEAVAIGMTCAARLAVQLQMIPADVLERQTSLLKAFSLPTECPKENHDQLLAAMKSDKKSERGNVRLILPSELGKVTLCDWPGDTIVAGAF